MFGFLGSKVTAWLGLAVGVAGVVAGAAEAVGANVANIAAVVGTVLAAIGGAILRPVTSASRRTDPPSR